MRRIFLGGISAVFEAKFPGIVLQAIGLTFGTLFCLLMAYKSGFIKATENFKLGVVAARGGVCFVYLLSLILCFFGIHMSFIHSSGPMGIVFSAFVVVIAALNLVLDFDFIEKLPANRIFPAIWSGTELLGLLSHLFGFILRSCAFWRN